MKYPASKLALLLAMALAPFISQGQVTFTINGTVNQTRDGFTTGEEVTFSFTLAQSPSPTGTAFINSRYRWTDYETTDPELWANVTGSPFTGSYVRPTAELTSPEMRLTIESDGGITLFASSQDYIESMGLSYGTNAATWILARAVYSGLTFDLSNPILPDATTYFSALTGTYAYSSGASSNTSFYYDGASDDIFFTPTSLTIASTAVPEPSTYAAITGVLILLGTIALRRRKAVSAAV